jgi:hypothetical protein
MPSSVILSPSAPRCSGCPTVQLTTTSPSPSTLTYVYVQLLSQLPTEVLSRFRARSPQRCCQVSFQVLEVYSSVSTIQSHGNRRNKLSIQTRRHKNRNCHGIIFDYPAFLTNTGYSWIETFHVERQGDYQLNNLQRRRRNSTSRHTKTHQSTLGYSFKVYARQVNG